MPGHENVFNNAEQSAHSRAQRAKVIDPKQRYKYKLFKRKRKEASPERIAQLRQQHETDHHLLQLASRYNDEGLKDSDRVAARAAYDQYQAGRSSTAEGHEGGLDVSNPLNLKKTTAKGLFSWLFNRGPQGGRAGHKDTFDSSTGQEYYKDAELATTNFDNFNPFGAMDGDATEAATDTEQDRDAKRLQRTMLSQVDDMAFRIDISDVDRKARNFGSGKARQRDGSEAFDLTDLNPEANTETQFRGKTGSMREFNMDPEIAMGEPFHNVTSLINRERADSPDAASFTPEKLSHYIEVITILPTESYRKITKAKRIRLPWNKISPKKDESAADFAARKKQIFGAKFLEQIKSGKAYKELRDRRKKQKDFNEDTDPVLLSYIADQKMTSYDDEGNYSTAGAAGHAYFRLRQRYRDKLVGQYSFGVIGGIGSETMASTAIVANPDNTTMQGTTGDVVGLGEKEISAQQELSAVGFVRSVIASGRSFNLLGYNCTAFAVEAAKAAGVKYNSTSTGVGLAGSRTKMDTPFDLVKNEGKYSERASTIETEISDDADTVIQRYSDRSLRRHSSLYMGLHELMVVLCDYSQPDYSMPREDFDTIVDSVYAKIAGDIVLKYSGDATLNTRLRNALRSYRVYPAEMGDQEAFIFMLHNVAKDLKDTVPGASVLHDGISSGLANRNDENAKKAILNLVPKDDSDRKELTGEFDTDQQAQTSWSDKEKKVYLKLNLLIAGNDKKIDSKDATVQANLAEMLFSLCAGIDISVLQTKMRDDNNYIVAIMRDIAKAIANTAPTFFIYALSSTDDPAACKSIFKTLLLDKADLVSTVGDEITRLFGINNRFGEKYTKDAARYGDFYSKIFIGLKLNQATTADEKLSSITSFLKNFYNNDHVNEMAAYDADKLLVLLAKALSATAELRGFKAEDLKCDEYATLLAELHRLKSTVTFFNQLYLAYHVICPSYDAGDTTQLSHPAGYDAPKTPGDIEAARLAEEQAAAAAAAASVSARVAAVKEKKTISDAARSNFLYNTAASYDFGSEPYHKFELIDIQDIYNQLKDKLKPLFSLEPVEVMMDDDALTDSVSEFCTVFGIKLKPERLKSSYILDTATELHQSATYAFWLFLIATSALHSGTAEMDDFTSFSSLLRLLDGYSNSDEFSRCISVVFQQVSEHNYNPDNEVYGGSDDHTAVDDKAAAPAAGTDADPVMSQFLNAAKVIGFVPDDFIPAANGVELTNMTNELTPILSAAFGFDTDTISDERAIELIVKAANAFNLGDLKLAECKDYEELLGDIFDTVSFIFMLLVFSVCNDVERETNVAKGLAARMETILVYAEHHKLGAEFKAAVKQNLTVT